MIKLKIRGVGTYMRGGILYYIHNKWPSVPIRVQSNVHWALVDIAQQFECPIDDSD